MLHSRLFLSYFATVTLFTVLAGDAWRYTFSWYGWGVVVLAIAGISVALLVAHRRRLRPGFPPVTLGLFLLLATASVFWSHYSGATMLGILALWATTAAAAALALLMDWAWFLRSLSRAVKWILALSIVFELIVSLVIRHPVLPLWVDYPAGDLPIMLYWSRDLLFTGQPIQGIVGNSSTLGLIALLGIIAFSIQLATNKSVTGGSLTTQKRRARWSIAWIVVAALIVLDTRSASVLLSVAVLAVVALAVLAVRRIPRGRPRLLGYGVFLVLLAAGTTLAIAFRSLVTSALESSGVLTGRAEIWEAVTRLAAERPAFGWGWVGYWAPWVAPFDTLAMRNGVQVMHAHNAWLDLWLQLGFVGVIVFAALCLFTLGRAWLAAIDAQTPSAITGADSTRRAVPAIAEPAVSLLPLLLLVALLVQSIAESRLLIEYGMLLLTFTAIATRATGRPNSESF